VGAGWGATRIEQPKKHGHLYLFDAYDPNTGRYLAYNELLLLARNYRIPIVNIFRVTKPNTMEELFQTRDEILEWCKPHKREGTVGKVFDGKYQIYFKEKINLPKRPKLKRPKEEGPQLPPMPHEKIISAIEQARAEVERSNGDFRDTKTAMPIVAKHIAAQAEEHGYAKVKNPFGYWQTYIEERL
jgi:hypothetical protein